MTQSTNIEQVSNAPMVVVDSTQVTDTGSSDPQPLRVVLRALRGRLVWAVLLSVIGAGVGAVSGYVSVELLYESTGFIRIKPNLKSIIYKTEDTSVMPMFTAYVGSQIQIMQSERILDMALEGSSVL